MSGSRNKLAKHAQTNSVRIPIKISIVIAISVVMVLYVRLRWDISSLLNIGIFMLACLVLFFSIGQLIGFFRGQLRSEGPEKANTIKSIVYLVAIFGILFASGPSYWLFQAQHEVGICPGWSDNLESTSTPILVEVVNRGTKEALPLSGFKDERGEQHLLHEGQALEIHDCVFYRYVDSAKLKKVLFRFVRGPEYPPVQITADDAGAVLDLNVGDENLVKISVVPKIGYDLTTKTFIQYLARWFLLLCLAVILAIYSLFAIKLFSSFMDRYLKQGTPPPRAQLIMIQSGIIAVWINGKLELEGALSVLSWLLITILTYFGSSYLINRITPASADLQTQGKLILFTFGASIVLAFLIPLQPSGMFGIFYPDDGSNIIYNSRLLGKIALFDLSMWAILTFLTDTRKVHPLNTSLTRRWILIYAFPLMVVGIVMLLAFWPGIMSQDSFDQWLQMSNFEFSPEHPIFHTLLNWMVTRVWMSPAAVASAQILGLSLTVGYVLYRFEKAGIPKLLVGAAALIAAIVPANAFYMVTLWKDVPFAMIYVWLTVFMFEIYSSNGRWITDRRNVALLGVMMTFVTLVRHNGFIEMTLLVIILLVTFKRLWRRWLVILIFVISTMTVTNYVFEHYLPHRSTGRDKLTQGKLSRVLEHRIRAHIYTGTELQQADRDLLSQTMPTLALFDSYNCHTSISNSVFYSSSLSDTDFTDELIRVYLAFISRSPWVEARHQICNLSRLWRVYPMVDESNYLSPARFRTNSGELTYHVTPEFAQLAGITQDSKIPKLANFLGRYTRQMSVDKSLMVAPWRVAPYVYIIIIGLIFRGLIYEKDWRFVIIGGPVIAHLALFFFTNIIDNFRYHYMILLIACILWPLLYLRGSIPGDAVADTLSNGRGDG
jgi:hypothetical protein